MNYFKWNAKIKFYLLKSQTIIVKVWIVAETVKKSIMTLIYYNIKLRQFQKSKIVQVKILRMNWNNN